MLAGIKTRTFEGSLLATRSRAAPEILAKAGRTGKSTLTSRSVLTWTAVGAVSTSDYDALVVPGGVFNPDALRVD